MKFIRVLHDAHVQKYNWNEYKKLLDRRAFIRFQRLIPITFLFFFLIGLFLGQVWGFRFCFSLTNF